MASLLGSITRQATRKDWEPLNVLTFPTHEAYETGLAACGHNFYAVRAQGIKDWNSSYRPVPSNYVLLNPDAGERQIPPDVDFDVVLSQNKFGQFQLAKQLASRLHLPLVSLEHTLPVPQWTPARRAELRSMTGDLNVFISEYSVGQWGWDKNDPSVRVLHHGIDTDTFRPRGQERAPRLLSVVNDWMNRDWCCGFRLWQQVSRGLPVRVVGATPGLSEPAPSVDALVGEYNASRVFLNTSLVSPVPTALLEAMACGCAVVSTATCQIPDIIEQGVNGLVSNEPEELAMFCQKLLNNPDLCARLGEQARRTVETRFNLYRFAGDWDKLLREAADIVYKG